MFHKVAKFITKKTLKEMLGVSYATIDRWEAEGRLPQRRVLSRNRHGRPTRVGWLESEIIDFMMSLPTGTPKPSKG